MAWGNESMCESDYINITVHNSSLEWSIQKSFDDASKILVNALHL